MWCMRANPESTIGTPTVSAAEVTVKVDLLNVTEA